MRQLSQTIKDVLAADWAETKEVVIITIPPQYGTINYPETTMYLANGEGIVVDGQEYQNRLRKVGSITFNLSKAPDDADITIENVSRDFGFTLTDFRRALDGSRVEIRKIFRTVNGWEPDTLFIGEIREAAVNQETIELSASSDMSKRGTSVAGRTITQRCLFRFNVNGSGIGPLCGWTMGQPGDPLACDKGLDTANGCQSHGNQHRFGGVPTFTNINAGTGYDIGGGGGGIFDGWGDGSGGGFCISIDSWVLCQRGEIICWTRAFNLRKGDVLISVDKFGKLTTTRINNLSTGNTSSLYILSTEANYSLSCSPTHRVMQDLAADEGVAVDTFKVGDNLLSYSQARKEYFVDTIKNIEVIKRSTIVLLLELEKPNHLFMAGNSQDGAIISHNMKPYYTTGDTGIMFVSPNVS